MRVFASGPLLHSQMSPTRRRIGFIGIGAQKCATTWLHDVLKGHPQLLLPAEKKEVDFFSYHHDFGYQWYEQQFAASDHALLAGEISPSYLHCLDAPRHAGDYNPAMRVILLVRDPIKRALSNHRHEVRLGRVYGDDLSFEYGLRNNPSYVDQGMYAKHLKIWNSVFPSEQIFVAKFDDVVNDAEDLLRRICRFLGVDDDYSSALANVRANESYLNRWKIVDSAKNSIRWVLRRFGMGNVWRALGDTGLRDGYRRVNRIAPESEIGEPRSETLEALRERFAPDCAELEKMTGISTQAWLRL